MSAAEALRTKTVVLDLGALPGPSVRVAVDRLAASLALTNAKETFDSFRGTSQGALMMNYAGNGDFGRYPYVDLYELLHMAAESEQLDGELREAAAVARNKVDEFVVASFGMREGFQDFKSGRNGVFVVFPDNGTWPQLSWYTPLSGKTPSDPYGRWAFLADGATRDNGQVENWFELLDLWFDEDFESPGGSNGYDW